ncbi:unnamed protein product [Meloidogyne enterolobii]|uniref:Uncharacterized protein n=1 Tax=Meloidogyne enterolobii TaxID=390850 RepID=A0ACB1A163_MELEN
MLTGDVKFIGSFMGHQGSSARYPCPICESTKTELCEEMGPKRTLDGIVPNEKSYTRKPLLPIEPSEIIPPAFHLLHGITSRAVELLVHFADQSGNRAQLEEKLRFLHCKRDKHTKQFRGGDLHKLVQDANIDELCSVISEIETRTRMNEFFSALQLMHKQSRIGFVNDINIFKERVTQVVTCWRNLKKFAKAGQMFPKLHLLAAHAVDFAKRNGWWSLVNEQGLESVHGVFNRLAPRYENVGDEVLSAEKVFRHQWMLNCLHDRGKENTQENCQIRQRRLSF